MKLFPEKVKVRLREMGLMTGLRDTIGALGGTFRQTPVVSSIRDRELNVEKVRRLYYNMDSNLSNGAFVVAPIIDGVSDHMGLPEAASGDENIDNVVNGWINNIWQRDFWEMYRNSLRDTKTWIRLRKPFPDELLAENERDDVKLEVYDHESVTPYFDPVTRQLVRVEILTEVYMEEEPFDPSSLFKNILTNPIGRLHEVVEVITPSQYSYYDRTTNTFLEQLTTNNDWGFVPLVEVFNDFDSALHGGRSEVEQAWPFIEALHDLFIQTRTAHGYHADPKVQFKVKDVMNFLRNNFPESFSSGEFTGTVNWKGRDIFFMESEEEAGFITATLATNDSVALMEFVIDCICIAAEVPESILFRAKAEYNTQTDELFRFKAKIRRKRDNFNCYIQDIIRMALKISTNNPMRVPLAWPAIDINDLVTEATALNQLITGAEVANRAGALSLKTYRAKIRPFFPAMKDDQSEEADVKSEQAAEQQQQLSLQQSLASINLMVNPNISGTKGIGASKGVNGAGRLGRTRPPISLVPPGD